MSPILVSDPSGMFPDGFQPPPGAPPCEASCFMLGAACTGGFAYACFVTLGYQVSCVTVPVNNCFALEQACVSKFCTPQPVCPSGPPG
jgi:hypothetical protein